MLEALLSCVYEQIFEALIDIICTMLCSVTVKKYQLSHLSI